MGRAPNPMCLMKLLPCENAINGKSTRVDMLPIKAGNVY